MTRKQARAAMYALEGAVRFDFFDPPITPLPATEPWVRIPGGTGWAFDRQQYLATRGEYGRWLDLREHAARRLTTWMRNIPFIGSLLHSWWYSVIDDATMLPIDSMVFGFLNDGMRPSLWHTWQQVISNEDAGLYVGRAPRSRAEAEWVRRNRQHLPLHRRVDR
jgi:hypothetical protein